MSPTGIGYVSEVEPPMTPAPDCKNPHVGRPARVVAKTNPRFRNRASDLAEYIRLDGWLVGKQVEADECDTDEVIQRLSLIITHAKELDRLVKSRRRATIKAMKSA